MARYTYKHIDKDDIHVTLCYSRYAGKPIYGKAVCSKEDTYVPEIGEQIARARLDAKVQRIRIKKHNASIKNAQEVINLCNEIIKTETARLQKDSDLLLECQDIIYKY